MVADSIPLSQAVGGVPGELGTPLSTSQVFQAAVTVFDEALVGNANSNLAKVGKGRALLDNGYTEVPITSQHAVSIDSLSASETGNLSTEET